MSNKCWTNKLFFKPYLTVGKENFFGLEKKVCWNISNNFIQRTMRIYTCVQVGISVAFWSWTEKSLNFRAKAFSFFSQSTKGK